MFVSVLVKALFLYMYNKKEIICSSLRPSFFTSRSRVAGSSEQESLEHSEVSFMCAYTEVNLVCTCICRCTFSGLSCVIEPRPGASHSARCMSVTYLSYRTHLTKAVLNMQRVSGLFGIWTQSCNWPLICKTRCSWRGSWWSRSLVRHIYTCFCETGKMIRLWVSIEPVIVWGILYGGTIVLFLCGCCHEIMTEC